MPETFDSQDQVPAQSQPQPWNPLRSLRHCGWWSVPTGIVLAIIAVYATLRSFEPSYLGTSLLEKRNEFGPFKGVIPTIQDLAKTEKDILFSPIVLDPVLADPKLRTASSLSDPHTAAANLRKNLSVADAGAGSQMKISYEDTDAEAAAMVCNAVVDSYLRQRATFDHQRSIDMERWLEPEIQRWEQEVEQRQRVVQKFSKQLSEYAISNSATSAGREFTLVSFSQLRSKISDVRIRLAVLDAQRSLDEPIEETQSAENEFQPDPELAQSGKKMKREQDLLAVELEVLNKKYDEERSQIERLGGVTAELQFAKDELEIATDVLSKLRSRVAVIRTESSRGGAVLLLAAAIPPQQPINSPPLKRMAAFSGFAFFSPLMLGFLLGFKRDTELDDRDNKTTDAIG